MFKTDYFVGHYEDSKLFLDSSYSSWDYIYHKGKMVDISFGLPFEKFISYLLPNGLTIEDIQNFWATSAFKDVFTEMSKETTKKSDQSLKKIDKVCKAFD